MSTISASERRGRIAFAVLTLALVGGAAAAFAVAAGIADPPRAGAQVRDLLPSEAAGGIAIDALPLTIEAEANLTGDPLSAWGVWLQSTNGQRYHFWVDGLGYIAAGDEAEPRWRPFPHTRRGAPNMLYLHIEADGLTIFRINREIAWRDRLDHIQQWGIDEVGAASLVWQRLQRFVP
ncbi:MAG: hypothetical protein SNJ59_11295 [Aggregatilineales bacterium]